MPQVGETWLHYKLLDFIGQGAMGQVFKAKDTRLDRDVALKFLLNTNLVKADHKARFVQEAKAVARLDHPHIGVLYALEQSREQMFLAMAYYQGQSLAEKLQEGLELQTSLRIFKDLLTGFQYAHDRGVIHRDIKPANIFVTQDGGVKILDFGLARLPNSNLTQVGQMMGTVNYISPEQIKGQDVDVRSDIWSLGVLLFHMLTGEFPFKGKFPHIITLIVKEAPIPLNQWLDNPALQSIIERCLAKDKHERFDSCDALREAIEAVELSQNLVAITPAQVQASPSSHPVSLSHKTQPLAEQSTAYEPKRMVGAVLTLRAFEGQQDKLVELRHSLQDNRLVQVCGPVGRGKTALSTQFINEDSHFGSIVFVTLRGQDPLVFERIVSLLLHTLPADKRQQLQILQKDEADLLKVLSTLLRTCIAEHKTLIVIDNLEDALENGVFTEAYTSLQAFVAGVLRLEGHACQLLMTSREPLDITSLGRDLGGMFDSVELSLEDGLSIPDGIALLRQLGDGKSGLKSAANEVLAQIVEQCEGIPLVLTNVAGVLKRGRTMNLGRFLNMSDKFEAMRREPAKTLYDSLTADEQTVMQVLAVFGKAVPGVAVRFLLPELDTGAILLGLETTYAVQFNDKGDAYTYTLRPIDQEYAYEQLAEDEHKDLHSKAAAFYRELRTPEESWQRLEDLQPQLDEFEQLIQAEAYDEACCVLLSIDYDYLILWGHAVLVRDLHLQLRNCVIDETLRSKYLGNLGSAYHDLGEVRRAIEYYEQALEISCEIHDRWDEGRRLSNLGNAYADLGEVHRAIEYYEQALEISCEIHDRGGEVVALGNLGSVYHDLGEVHHAIEYHEQALEIAREVYDRRSEGTLLNNLGNACSDLGKVYRAIEYQEQALEIAREIHDRGGEGVALDNLGSAYADLGEVHRAIEYHEQALEIAREVHDRGGEGIDLGNLGSAYSDLGDFQYALQNYQEGLAIVREVNYCEGESEILSNLGLAFYKLGDLENAISHCKDALVIACGAGYRRIESSALDRLGLVYRDLSELDKMLACGTVALTSFDAMESPKARGVAEWLFLQHHKRIADFDALLRSLFPDGDTILNEATGQNYTFFADAPADMPDRILALIDQYAEDREENEPHDTPNS